MIASGEGPRLEFLSRVPTPSRLANLISAFGNADGGVILIGVTDEGETRPVDPEHAANVLHGALMTVKNQPRIALESATIDQTWIGIITVGKGDKPVLASDLASVRVGTSLQRVPASIAIRSRSLEPTALEPFATPPVDPRLSPGNLDGWQPVEPVEALGQGRQGTVYKVRSPTAHQQRSDAAAQMAGAIKALSAANRDLDPRALDVADALARFTTADTGERRLGAVKLFTFEAGDQGKRDRARLQAEIAILTESGATQPGLLHLFHANLQKEFFITKYYESNLGAVIDERPATYRGDLLATLAALRPVVSAAAWLYENKKVVHRDIKPDNIFVDEDGGLVLGDLGIALKLDLDKDRQTAQGDRRPKGTMAWMAPWAYEGARPVPLDKVDGSFDVFSLGKVMWSMLLGEQLVWPHAFYDDPDDEQHLEKAFPRNAHMRVASEILGQCVVRKRKQCLDSPEKLLEMITTALNDIVPGRLALRRFEASPNSREVSGGCIMCGTGSYVFNRQGAVRLAAERTGKASSCLLFACNHCGHVEFFETSPSLPPAWRR
jgi:serine/threonine protein kinase